jgi:hypothetical protein
MAMQHIEGSHVRKDGVSITYRGTYSDGFNPSFEVETFSGPTRHGVVAGSVTIHPQPNLEDWVREAIHAKIDERV